MKRILILVIALLIFFQFPREILAQDTGWRIDNFDSQINVLNNGEVRVNETIDVDFSTFEHHGIYRDLIYKKDSTGSQKHYISYSINQVRLDNSSIAYTTNYQEDFFRLKIGNPSKTITGKHTYQIEYIATGALSSFSDHDELYWNVTGNYWTIPILNASAKVTLPKEGITEISCYFGVLGATSPCESTKNDSSIASFQTTQTLNSGEGLTAVVGFTKDLVPILEGKEPPVFGFELIDVLICSLTFLPIFSIAFYLWYKKGRDHWFKRRFIDDPNTRDELKPIGDYETIVVEFDPPEKLRPAEMGILLKEDVSTTAITATIVDLAVRGYLKINETKSGFIIKTRDYELEKQNKDWMALEPFENELITRLFEKGDSIKISSLKSAFYKDITVVKDSINQAMKDKGFFFDNPGKTKYSYMIIGGVLAIVPIVLGVYLNISFPHSGGLLVGLVFGGLSVMFFGYFMSARTAKGHELKNRVLGYKLFISTAEKYRQQFFEKQNMFNDILPYAILFGQTEKFAKAFADLGLQTPQTNWYVGAAAFNAASFSSDISAFAGAFSSSMSSSSGFSGGSGGGGGGGGGGGW